MAITLEREVDFIETAKGSRYTYLPDGRTQRFKANNNTISEPQDALVFIPPFDWIVANAPVEYRNRNVFGQDSGEFEGKMLGYAHDGDKNLCIADAEGRVLETNQQISRAGPKIFLALLNKTGSTDFCIPISKSPHLGYNTFDQRTWKEGNQRMTQLHLGNKVVKIVYKDGEIVSC